MTINQDIKESQVKGSACLTFNYVQVNYVQRVYGALVRGHHEIE